MKRKQIIVGCLCACFCCLCLFAGCGTTMNIVSAQKKLGGVSSVTIYTNVLSSQVLYYHEQNQIDEVLNYFDSVKFVKTSVDQQDMDSIEQSSVNVNAFGGDSQWFTVSITKDNKVYLQVDNTVYVAADNSVSRDEFVSKYGVVVIN